MNCCGDIEEFEDTYICTNCFRINLYAVNQIFIMQIILHIVKIAVGYVVILYYRKKNTHWKNTHLTLDVESTITKVSCTIIETK